MTDATDTLLFPLQD